ncbi:MAG TPA: GDSL-type esterase/lipase family protein [Candidatus Baltobacteraceae bacterium]|nr:GDSL-type esterase/lipase family protein [Candidatus Baltobacteraceae bacterium]
MFKNSRWQHAATGIALLFLSACGSNNVGPSMMPGNASNPQSDAIMSRSHQRQFPLEYVALGDSTTVGIGTSVCGLLPSATCPTSPTHAGISNLQPTVPVNGGYAQTFAAELARRHAPISFTFDALGVSGALTGDAPLPESPLSGDLLTNPAQVPALPQIAAQAQRNGAKLLVTLFSGNNDVLDAAALALCTASGHTPTGGGATTANPCGSSATTLTGPDGKTVRLGSFYQGYRAVLNAIAATSPERLLVIGIPDLSRVPLYATAPTTQKGLLAQGSLDANAAIQAALTDAHIPNSAFVDVYAYLAAHPQFYASTYYAGDGFHPNDKGYAVLEEFLESRYDQTLNDQTFNNF